MTTPAYGTWDYTWDGASGVLPAAGGAIVTYPTPIEGSVAGGIWTINATTYDSLTRNVSALGFSVWCEARAISCPTTGSIPGGDYSFGLITTNNAGSVGYILVTPDGIYAVDNAFNADLVVSMDMASTFHRISTVMDGSEVKVYVDDVLVGSPPPIPFGLITTQVMGTSAPASAEFKGIAMAEVVVLPTDGGGGDPEEPLPDAVSEIHLGAAGLTIDFDDVAHYATQLTSGQVAYHNTVGRDL